MKQQSYFKYSLLALLVAVVIFGVTTRNTSPYPSNTSEQTTTNPATVHYAVSSLKSFFDEAYTTVEKPEPVPGATGILVNHHLFGAHLIAESFGKVATNEPLTVLIISPDHFGTGQSLISTSVATWQTPYGEVLPDLNTIAALEQAKIVTIDEPPFEQEHGISGIVPFVKSSLPHAKIIPLIVQDQLQIEQALDVAKQISTKLPRRTLIVGSFDFSHYLTHRASDFHDLESLSVVQNFDYKSIHRLDIDSRPGLAIFLKLQELAGSRAFHLLQHSNSAVLARSDSILETTSYITGYFTASNITNPQDNTATHTLLVLGNIDTSNLTLTSLNRYSPNFSIKFLERLFFGQDTTVAFTPPSKELTAKLGKLQINSPIHASTEFKLGSLKITYIHPQDNEDAYSLAKTAIDNGTDIVITNNTLGKIKTYKNKLIFSGLGQLLTEQTLSSKTPTQNLAVGFGVTKDELTIYLLPIKVEKGVAQLLTSPADAIVLEDLVKDKSLSPDLKKQILSGQINIKLNHYGTK